MQQGEKIGPPKTGGPLGLLAVAFCSDTDKNAPQAFLEYDEEILVKVQDHIAAIM